MFGLSMAEIAVIAILALIVFGPERIPSIARTVGKTLRELRRAASDVQRSFEVEELRRELRTKNTASRPAALPSAAATPPATTPAAASPAAASPAAAAVSSPSAGVAPPLPTLRAPVQSVPALQTFSALRDAVSDEGSVADPLDALAEDDDAVADAEDLALSERLRAYLAASAAAPVALPPRQALADALTSVALPPRQAPAADALTSVALPPRAEARL
jgi:sec-independent protein translocase protein TatB